jgi:hypothetical protein
MSIMRYAVLRVGAEWRVVCARRRIGRYTTRARAVEAGARLAREAVEPGHAVEIMMQDHTGLLFAQNFVARAPEATAVPAPQAPA